jgi:hypothetical protein
MTPESIRIISQLRSEFYSRFATAMGIPVKITNGNSFSGNLSTASWMDNRQELNYVRIYAYTAPDVLVPDRPFVLRVAVNKGIETISPTNRMQGCQGLNRRWNFELTLLPEEILDFLPWIVDLVMSYERSSASVVSEPPHPFDLETSSTRLFQSAQTHRAGSSLSKQLLPAVGKAPRLRRQGDPRFSNSGFNARGLSQAMR